MAEIVFGESRVEVAWGCFRVDDFADAMAAVFKARFEEGGKFGIHLWAAPHGEDHGEASVAEPLFAKVQHVKAGSGGIDAKGRIADDERGIGGAKHRSQIGNHRLPFGFQVVDLFEENPGEHDRRSRGAVERKAPDLPDGFLAEEKDAADGSAAGDAEIGDGLKVLALGLNDRDQAGVGVLIGEQVCANRGDVETEVGLARLRAVEQAPHEGASVEIADRA